MFRIDCYTENQDSVASFQTMMLITFDNLFIKNVCFNDPHYMTSQVLFFHGASKCCHCQKFNNVIVQNILLKT